MWQRTLKYHPAVAGSMDRRDHLRRRRLLRAMGGAGVASPLSSLAPGGGTDGGRAADEPSRTPHTEATFRALVDALVPETPQLSERGEVHVPGGLDVDVDEFVMWVLDNYLRVPLTADLPGETAPLSGPVAAALDAAASDLLARGGNEDDVDPSRFPGGGTFASLSRDDRVRTLRDLESRDGGGDLPAPFDQAGLSPAFLVSALHALVNAGHYTEWSGYGPTKLDAPTRWEFQEPSLGWRQTGYPGPADGYADHRGYEVRQFRENDYREDLDRERGRDRDGDRNRDGDRDDHPDRNRDGGGEEHPNRDEDGMDSPARDGEGP